MAAGKHEKVNVLVLGGEQRVGHVCHYVEDGEGEPAHGEDDAHQYQQVAGPEVGQVALWGETNANGYR